MKEECLVNTRGRHGGVRVLIISACMAVLLGGAAAAQEELDWPKDGLEIDGQTLRFGGVLDYRSGVRHIRAKNGGGFTVGPKARINNYTGAAQWTREMYFHGDTNSVAEEVFEIDRAFVADQSGFDPEGGKHDWEPFGFCQLSMENATLKTHSTKSIPSMLKRMGEELVPDAELNFMGTCTWIVDTEHQVYRGTCRSWRDLTIVTHKDLTVIPDGRIPNSRFGDRTITKKGKGVLHVAGRQFYYLGPPHLKQEGRIPVLRVEEGTLRMRTNPFAHQAGEGNVRCVAPRIEVGPEGRMEFLARSTVESIVCDGLTRMDKGGKVVSNCRLSDSSVLVLPPPRLSRMRASAAALEVGGDLEMGGTLRVDAASMKPGRYPLFRVAGKTAGAFKAIEVPAGLTGALANDGQMVISAK